MKANVLFFDKQPITSSPATTEIWIYDLRSNRNFSIRQNPITSADLKDFVDCYKPGNLGKRQETPHFRRFKYAEVIAREKASLDIQWQTEKRESGNGLMPPEDLVREILKDLQEALNEFATAEREIL